jgi:hypothetical protein
MRTKLILPSIILLLTITLISAASFSDFSSPLDYLKNEWVMFGIIFIISLGLVYSASLKTLDYNKGLAGSISAALALLISIALTRKATLYTFLGEGIGDWIIIIILIIFIIVFVKYFAFSKQADGTRKFSLIKLIIGIVILFAILTTIDAYDSVPDSIKFGPLGDFIEMIQGLTNISFIILIIGLGGWILWKIIKFFRKKKVLGSGNTTNVNVPPQAQQQVAPQQRQQKSAGKAKLLRYLQGYRAEINKMGGPSIAKGTPGYRKFIRLQKNIKDIQKRLKDEYGMSV